MKLEILVTIQGNPRQQPILQIQEKSKFGTILNDEQIKGKTCTLNNGDLITFGTLQSQYR